MPCLVWGGGGPLPVSAHGPLTGGTGARSRHGAPSWVGNRLCPGCGSGRRSGGGGGGRRATACGQQSVRGSVPHGHSRAAPAAGPPGRLSLAPTGRSSPGLGHLAQEGSKGMEQVVPTLHSLPCSWCQDKWWCSLPAVPCGFPVLTGSAGDPCREASPTAGAVDRAMALALLQGHLSAGTAHPAHHHLGSIGAACPIPCLLGRGGTQCSDQPSHPCQHPPCLPCPSTATRA